LHCPECQGEVSVTAGTIFEKTRYPLKQWYSAIWFITSQKHGANAMGLQRVLGLKTYKTAWTWLHKLRRAMICPGRNLLEGSVEVDETFIGGEEPIRGRGARTKALVVIAVEILSPKGFGRVRMKAIPDASSESLEGFITQEIQQGSSILTDGWIGYQNIGKRGFKHSATITTNSKNRDTYTMTGVHRVAALLKRWLLGTHQGAVRHQHLDYYLDEFTFRFNRRTSRSRGLLFYRLMQQAASTPPTIYEKIIGGVVNHEFV
jgi:transposase-like protein